MCTTVRPAASAVQREVAGAVQAASGAAPQPLPWVHLRWGPRRRAAGAAAVRIRGQVVPGGALRRQRGRRLPLRAILLMRVIGMSRGSRRGTRRGWSWHRPSGLGSPPTLLVHPMSKRPGDFVRFTRDAPARALASRTHAAALRATTASWRPDVLQSGLAFGQNMSDVYTN